MNSVDPNSKKDERTFLNLKSDDEDLKEWVEAERHTSFFTITELRKMGFQIGKTIEDIGVKEFLKKVKRVYRNLFEKNSLRVSAVMDLNKPNSPYSDIIPPPKKVTENFDDFR